MNGPRSNPPPHASIHPVSLRVFGTQTRIHFASQFPPPSPLSIPISSGTFAPLARESIFLPSSLSFGRISRVQQQYSREGTPTVPFRPCGFLEMTTMIVRAEGFLCASSATVYSMAITSFAGKDASAELNPDSPAAAASLPVAVVETKPRCGGGGYAPRFDGLRFIETLVTAHR